MTLSSPPSPSAFLAKRAATTAPPAPTSVLKRGTPVPTADFISASKKLFNVEVSEGLSGFLGFFINLRVIFTAPTGKLRHLSIFPSLPKTTSRLPPPKSKYAVGSVESMEGSDIAPRYESLASSFSLKISTFVPHILKISSAIDCPFRASLKAEVATAYVLKSFAKLPAADWNWDMESAASSAALGTKPADSIEETREFLVSS